MKWLNYSRQLRIHQFTPRTLQESLQSCRNAALPPHGEVLLLGDICHAYGCLWSLLPKSASNPHDCSLKRSRSIACSLGVNLLEKGSPSWRKMSSLEHLRINHYLPWRTAAPEEGGGQDSTEGGNYFSRRRICGEKFLRLVCCPASFLGYFHNIIHIKGALKSHYI